MFAISIYLWSMQLIPDLKFKGVSRWLIELNLYLKQKGYMVSQKNPGMETSFQITKKPNYKLYV